MKNGDVILIRLAQAGGTEPKLRPALLLATLPGPYQSLLICGISTQLHEIVQAWDERVAPGDGDFQSSGLRRASAIRLSYLYAAMESEIVGTIGRIDGTRLARLRGRLIRQLQA